MHQRAFGLSQWTVTAATAAAAAGITVEQPEGPADGSMHLAADCRTGRTRAGAAGIPVRAHFEGPCLSFYFALIFFLKDHVLQLGPLSQSLPGHQCLIFYFFIFWTPCTLSCWGERSWEGLCLVLGGRQLADPLRASFKHQHLKRTDGWIMRGCGQVSLLSHVLLTSETVPMNVI